MRREDNKVIQLMKLSKKATAIYGNYNPVSNEWEIAGRPVQCLALYENGDISPVVICGSRCERADSKPDFIGVYPADLMYCPYPWIQKKQIEEYFGLKEGEHEG